MGTNYGGSTIGSLGKIFTIFFIILLVVVLAISISGAFHYELEKINKAEKESHMTEQEKFDEQYETVYTKGGNEVIVDKKTGKKFIIDKNGDVNRIDGFADKDIQVKI